MGAATGMLSHTCPGGLVHRLTNTLGCALLLGSNYYGRKYSEGCVGNALAEAWGSGGEDGNTLLCIDLRCIDPSCNALGANASNTMGMEGEIFFAGKKKQLIEVLIWLTD